MSLLARREHSEKELQRKLANRQHHQDDIEAVLQVLKQEGLQSDSRFAETYLHSRREKGYGPARIARELRERGVPEELFENILDEADNIWRELAQRTREKKFGSAAPSSYKDQAKQSRFLQYRGFTSAQIRSVFNADD